MTQSKNTKHTLPDMRKLGEAIGIDWTKYDIDQFTRGYAVELEHGSHDKQTDVTHNDPIKTAKIVLAHLKEIPHYYDLLEEMEKKALQ